MMTLDVSEMPEGCDKLTSTEVDAIYSIAYGLKNLDVACALRNGIMLDMAKVLITNPVIRCLGRDDLGDPKIEIRTVGSYLAINY